MTDHEQGALLVHVVRVNLDAGYSFYDEREELDSRCEDLSPKQVRGLAYRDAAEEYGRCTGKVYNDRRVRTNDNGGERWETIHVGWVFIKREVYADTGEPYLCETWVTLERVVEGARPTLVESLALGGSA